jgi:hypothetical protein
MTDQSYHTRLAEFKGLVKGILADGILVVPEVKMLRHWIKNHPDLQQQSPFSHIHHLSLDIQSELDAGPIEKLKGSLLELLGKAQAQTEKRLEKYGILLDQPTEKIETDARICFCGKSKKHTDNELKEFFRLNHLELEQTVKLNTQFIVLAELDQDWRNTIWATPIEQAISYREMGTGLLIIDENEFWKLAP